MFRQAGHDITGETRLAHRIHNRSCGISAVREVGINSRPVWWHIEFITLISVNGAAKRLSNSNSEGSAADGDGSKPVYIQIHPVKPHLRGGNSGLARS